MFKKINKKSIITKNGNKVIIYKYQKEGTKRTFFAPENEDGKRLNTIMFARMYDAEKLGRLYLDHISN